MRTPEEIKAEIEEKLAQFNGGAVIIFDVGPNIYLACDIFRVVRVAPIYAEDGSEEAVHWFLGYNPSFHTSSHYGAAGVVKVLKRISRRPCAMPMSRPITRRPRSSDSATACQKKWHYLAPAPHKRLHGTEFSHSKNKGVASFTSLQPHI